MLQMPRLWQQIIGMSILAIIRRARYLLARVTRKDLGKRPRKKTQTKWKLKIWGTKGAISNDGAIYSATCPAQSNDGHTYIGVGKLNGWPVKVLRDTGCTGMIVNMALVPHVMCRFAADGRPWSD